MSKDLNDAKLTAYVLGELSDKEMKEIELLIKNDPKLKADVESIKSFTQLMRSELKVEPVPVLKDNVKQNINSEINKKLFLAKLFSWNSPLKIALSTGFVFVVCFITLDKFDDLQSTAPTNEVVELTNVEEASIDKEVVETPEAKVTFNNPKQKVRKKFTITSSNRKALKKSYSASRRSFKEGVSGGSKGVKASYKKGANLKSIRVDPSKTGLLSTFGSKGVQKKLSKSRSRKSFIVRDKKPEPIEPIIVEFKKPLAEPLSTFSIDVDTASYSHARKQIMSHSKLPSPNDVRIEEFVNYFKYNDKTPSGDEPFSVGLELSESPWNEGYELVRIALKGKATKTKLRKKNLVFVVDTSGSMNNIDKIPLLKDGLNGLVDQLNSHDTISIIKYAGSHGIHLQPTNGLKKDEIKQAINSLMASGSTNGEGGIKKLSQVFT